MSILSELERLRKQQEEREWKHRLGIEEKKQTVSAGTGTVSNLLDEFMLSQSMEDIAPVSPYFPSASMVNTSGMDRLTASMSSPVYSDLQAKRNAGTPVMSISDYRNNEDWTSVVLNSDGIGDGFKATTMPYPEEKPLTTGEKALAWTEWIAGNINAGTTAFTTSVGNTLDATVGNILKGVGWENNPISKLNEGLQNDREMFLEARDRAAEKLGLGKGARIVEALTEGTVAAVPMALEVILTAGSSLAPTAASLADDAIRAAGTLLQKIGLTASSIMKNPQFWMSFTQTYGNEYYAAIESGASESAAVMTATAKSLINSGIEIGIDGGSGMQGLMDDVAKGGKKLLSWIESAIEEGLEEVAQGFIGRLIDKFALGKDVKVLDPWTSVQEFGMGTAIGSILGSGQLIADAMINGAPQNARMENAVDRLKANALEAAKNSLTETEQQVVDKEYETRLAEAEKDGKLTDKEKAKLYDRVVEDLNKGYISTDTIEEVLGGETYKSYQDTVKAEEDLIQQEKSLAEESKKLEAMVWEKMTGEQQVRRDELRGKLAEIRQKLADMKKTSSRDQLKAKLGEEVQGLANGSRLMESYNEAGRRKQAFEADLSQYDAKQQEVVKKAVESGILNNTRRTHEFVDFIAKISADKGVLFDFTNNAKLKESGFAVNGKFVNGYVTKDGVTINIQSTKSLNSVVGHEITHVLEGTELYNELQSAVTEYAKTKGDYKRRYDALAKLYENVEGADINAELTADLVGDYLFTDSDFIGKLSTEHRNVFQKIFDEVKHLLKLATAGSKEAQQLEKVKRAFEKAYRATKNTDNTGVKRSLSDSTGKQLTKGQAEYFADSKARDDDGRLVKVYHSTHDAGFFEFKGSKNSDSYLFGKYGKSVTYFTDNKQMADSYAPDNTTVDTRKRGKVVDAARSLAFDVKSKLGIKKSGQYEGYVNITNPYAVDAKGRDWNTIDNALAEADFNTYMTITSEEKDAVRKYFKGEVDEDYEGQLYAIALYEAGTSEPRTDAEKRALDRELKSNRWETTPAEFKDLFVSALRKLGSDSAVMAAVRNNFSADGMKDFYTRMRNTNDIVLDALKLGTYDGVIIKNVVNYGSYADASDLPPGNLYVTFNPEQFKAADNQNPTSDTDIRYSLSEAVEKTNGERESPKSYAEIVEEQQNLYQRENSLRERKQAAVNNPELLQAMDDYSALFNEMRTLLPKRRDGTATKEELDRIEEIKALREERMMRVTELQESLGLKAISEEEAEIRETKETLRKAADDAWAREGAEKENKAIEKAGVPAAEYFRKKALKAFKTTTNFNEAGYMLPDGKLLNFSGGERNHRYRDHREIGEIYEATQGAAALNRFLNDGNIRIMAESPGIDLASGVEPTKEQYAALRKFVNTNGVADGQFFVDFSGANGERVGKYEYNGRILADRIINDIKYFFQNGKVRESSGLLDFLSISYPDEAPTKYGDYNVYGEDVALETDEDVAPVVENAALVEGNAIAAEETYQDDVAAPQDVSVNVLEEAANEDDIAPLLPGSKRRKWVGTSTASEVVDGQVAPEDLDQDLIHYQPISNKKTLGNANAMLDSKGYEASVAYMSQRFAANRVSLDDIALGERLIQEAVKRGDTKTAQELIMDISILGTELGQKVQALSIIKRLTPEGQLKMLMKVVERGKAKGDKAFNGVEVTQEQAAKILDTRKPDGTFDQAELNKAVEDVKQEIANNMSASLLEIVNEWRYLAMLGNPKTHIRNLVSNAAMLATRQTKNVVARTAEDIVGAIDKDIHRTKTWKAASQYVRDYAKKVTNEEYEGTTGNKYSEAGDIKSKRNVLGNNVFGAASKFNSAALTAEDTLFSKPAFRESFREYLTANGIRTEADVKKNGRIVAEAKAYAAQQAKEATFQQDSYIASKINEIEGKNPLFNMAIGAVLPFKKTPINIAKTGLAYSPLGIARNIYDAVKVSKGEMEVSEAIDHVAQTLTGTALALIGYALASNGILNGAGGEDKEDKYDYQLGKQSYSFNFDGDTFSLSWLSPVAMPMFVGANAYEQLVEDQEWDYNVVMEALAQTLDPLNEMSFLSSLSDVLSSYDSGMAAFGGMLETAAQSYVTSFVPTLSSQIAQISDDKKRSTKISANSSADFLEETWNAIKYKVPGLRQTLEPATDIWGNEIPLTDDAVTKALETFIAPYARKEGISTKVDDEIKNIYRLTGNDGVIPNIPGNSVNYKNEKYEMSAAEYTQFKEDYGQTAYDLMEDLIQTDTYQRASADDKAKWMDEVFSYAMDEAKKNYLESQGVEYTNSTKDGVPYYRENAIKGAIENDMTPEEYKLYLDDPEKYELAQRVGGLEAYNQYKDATKDMKLGEKADYIAGMDLSTEQKNLLINSETDRKEPIDLTGIENYSSFEEFEFAKKYPGKYAMAKAVGGYDSYLVYADALGDIESDKDEWGQSINGTKKPKVYNYIYSLDIPEIEKHILFKSQYPSTDDHNMEIVEYLNDHEDLSYDEVVAILLDLDFKVSADGMVRW
jgi:hypothetical protein